MKTKLTLLLLVVLTRALYAVGNEVIDDIAALQRAGFEFKKVEYGCTERTICFEVQIPPDYASDQYEGRKPFQFAAYIKPEDPDAKGHELIFEKGARLKLSHRKEGTRNSVTVSVLRAEAPGAYLEFHFNHGPRSAPMLVHVPLKAIVAFLDKPPAERPVAVPPVPAAGSKPEGKEKAQPGKEGAPR
jgi:hypothetical protein